ncbi:hypothetical protein BOTBODRAFT_30800 [Botryobasidium botryosum FD-172 SS1]|uniref:Uncharacterized protein n=1 Tax=Botryobasidium botryosum (strain FD-172 SS1) TaxID=930990 RepID=A0A067MX59_BOTB1|nr:hypothetical protein BOTBODRAFT_30800 [Botryobasidium botryosum FD-172 SS1]
MNTILLVIIAILFPPLAVFFLTGCGADLLINILLTILGFLPGHIHAFYLIWKSRQLARPIGGAYAAPGYGTNTTTTMPVAQPVAQPVGATYGKGVY